MKTPVRLMMKAVFHDGLKKLAKTKSTCLSLLMVLGLVGYTQGQTTAIPDSNFEQALIDLGHDDVLDGEVLTGNISTVTSLDVSSKSISNLTGIEGFVELDTLLCQVNQLTSLNLSNNVVLTFLNCAANQLTSLDVSSNTALTFLGCYYNQLTTLDLSANAALTVLQCEYNQLASLDLSANTALTYLGCNSNQLTSLNVLGSSELTHLNCYSNQLTNLDVSANTALTHLSCYSNQLANLDLSQNTDLVSLSCYSNQLTSLDVSANTALTTFYCQSNQLTSMDISNNTALRYLVCLSNQLSSLDVLSNTALIILACSDNPLTSLDVSSNTALSTLSCTSNQLTSLDVSKNTSLNYLEATSNPDLHCIRTNQSQLDAIPANWSKDVTAEYNTDCSIFTSVPDGNFEQALIDLEYDDILDGSVLTANINTATTLDVRSKGIADLTGIEDFMALETLLCEDNHLASLDVSSNTTLTYLDCKSNQLTSIDVSQNTGLGYLITTSNPDLYCIRANQTQLDAIPANWSKDPTTGYYLDCPTIYMWYIDDDNDGHGIPAQVASTNPIPGEGESDISDDCDDTNPYSYPGASELCDGVDNDCDAVVDEDVQVLTWYLDTDEDGYGDLLITQDNCAIPVGYVLNADDCDDSDPLEALHCGESFIPDPAFEQVLIDLGYDDDLDDWVQTDNITSVLTLNLTSKGITDLTGIEDFVALKNLYASGNALISVDLSQNTDLLRVQLHNNNLTGDLDLSANPNLLDVRVHNNNIGSIDISNSSGITLLYVQGNDLGDLDVSHLTSLTTLNTRTNVALHCIRATQTQIDNVPGTWYKDPLVEYNTDCASQYTSVPDVVFELVLLNQTYDKKIDGRIYNGKVSGVTGLFVQSKGITDLTGIEAFTSLQTLYAQDNNLTTLDVSQNTALETLLVQENQLTNLDLTSNTLLDKMWCYTNQLTELNLKNQAVLTNMYSTNNPNLVCIEVNDAGNIPAGWTKGLNSTYTTNCNDLYTSIPDPIFEEVLSFWDNLTGDGRIPTAKAQSITGLNLSLPTSATELEKIQDLTGIDQFTSLVNLYIDNHSVATLDLTNSPNMRIVYAANNGLTSLDLSDLTQLELVHAHKNQLTDIDVSASTGLTRLYAHYNQLGDLDVSNNTSLTTFYATVNPNLTCINIDASQDPAPVGWYKDAASNYSINCASARMGGEEVSEETIEERPISLYPNPAQGHFNVEVSDWEGVRLEVYDLAGQLVTTPIKLTERHTRISTTKMVPGIKVVRTIRGEEVHTVKLLVR